MFLVADASQREELAKQFLTRLPLTEDHAEWRVVLNAIELLIQQGNQEVNNSFHQLEFADQNRSVPSIPAKSRPDPGPTKFWTYGLCIPDHHH